MSRRNVRGLMFSLEDMDETVVVDENSVAPIEAEITEEGGELEGAVDSFEEDSDNLTAMEKIAIAIEDSLGDDGLPEKAAEIAEITLEHLCARLGMSNAKLMVANEQFGSTNTRLAATQISLEEEGGVWDTVKKGAEAAKKYIMDLFARIADFFRKVVSGFAWQEKRIADMEKKVSDIGTKSIKNTSFDDKTISDNFRFSPQGGNPGAEANGKTCLAIIGETNKLVVNVKGVASGFTAQNQWTGVSGKMSIGLIGGARFLNDGEEGKEQMSFVDPASTGGGNGKATTLKKDEMNQILTACKDLMGVTKAMVTKDVDPKKTASNLINGLKDAEKKATSTDEKKEFAATKERIRNAAVTISKVSTKTPGIAIKTVSGALAYVNKSCAQYEK